ncbi:hypothetical protein [Spirosoma sordidisoli]|uniref:Uncharacterized protein n=1 Tax=Spirosoma sordidisoli TaxID=2502893 RepID=A0A4Q2UPB9_9BACT|nr:hypothetical protein [Spirosoma sordidisoli]RYC69641.1 hypothetical protein EQG79_13655 [Spirosoma sordidisoli]
MTWMEAHDRITFFLSQEGRPWYNQEEIDMALQQAQRDWLRQELSAAESNGESRESLGLITRIVTGEGTVIDMSADKFKGLVRLLSIECRWKDPQTGSAGTFVAVRPVSRDALARTMRNPFGRATDAQPLYVMGQPNVQPGSEPALQVTLLSESPPSSWRVSFVVEPAQPDGANKPDDLWTGVGPLQQQQIIQRAVQWLMHQQDNTPAWQRQAQTQT